MNLNYCNHPKMLQLETNRSLFGPHDLETIWHIFHANSSFVHYSIAICEFKLKLRLGDAQFVSELSILGPVWPWNLTEVLEKQEDTTTSVNSNGSYGFKWLYDLHLWPVTLTLCMDNTSINGNTSGKCHDVAKKKNIVKNVLRTDGQDRL